MGFIIGDVTPQLEPLKETIEALKKDWDEKYENSQSEIKNLKSQLNYVVEQLNSYNEQISQLAGRIKIMEKELKTVHTTSGSKPTTNQDVKAKDSKPQEQQKSITQGPIKRYFSSCGMSGFDISYMLSNPAAISGQGYYEVTDRGDDTGCYQPNTNLAPTLLMNATNMLDPFFEVEHDGSGHLNVIAPGELIRQGRVWQIVKKCKIVY